MTIKNKLILLGLIVTTALITLLGMMTYEVDTLKAINKTGYLAEKIRGDMLTLRQNEIASATEQQSAVAGDQVADYAHRLHDSVHLFAA